MSDPKESERRSHTRFEVWFPVRMDVTGETSMGVSFDASEGGLLLMCGADVPVGAKIRVAFEIPPGSGEEHTAVGTVVRITANDADPHGMWPNRLALRFDEDVPGLSAVLRAQMERASSPDLVPTPEGE